MLVQFTKMHGLGNDFVVLDLITQRFHLQAKHIRFLADRNFGVGCDQVLVVEAPLQPAVDFRYRIFNADGSEVEQCGNGARCFAKYVKDKKLTGKNTIVVETSSGIITLHITPENQVEVNMGAPIFEPGRVPFKAEQQQKQYQLKVENETVTLGALSIGNPHAVIIVEDTETAPVNTLGAAIESHTQFPNRTNVGFLQIIDRQHALLRVFERGVGETKACGTGACAAMVYARSLDLLDDKASIELPGGKLQIEWRGPGHDILMTGPATTVFEGKIHL
jgi:diaminopimelate epimerase